MNNKVETYEAVWRADVETYETVYCAWLRIRKRDGDKVSEEQRQALREIWKLRERLLRQFIRVKAQLDVYLEPFPFGPMMQLADDCEDLSQGTISNFIEGTRSNGRPLLRRERHDIAKAVYFLAAVDSGEIEFLAPVKTVAETFDVTKQTVRNWRKRSAEICEGVPCPHPNLLEESMRHAGFKYTRYGRGAPSR